MSRWALIETTDDDDKALTHEELQALSISANLIAQNNGEVASRRAWRKIQPQFAIAAQEIRISKEQKEHEPVVPAETAEQVLKLLMEYEPHEEVWPPELQRELRIKAMQRALKETGLQHPTTKKD